MQLDARRDRDRPSTGELLVAAAFFLSVFVLFFHPIKLGDFWWHLTSGRWIAEHRALPDTDQISFSTSNAPDIRRTVMLKNYWLAQLGYYGLYKAAGFIAIAAANAALFSLSLAYAWRMLLRGGMQSTIALALIAPAAMVAWYFDEVRPHAFSFVFAMLVMDLFERGINSIEANAAMRPRQMLYACLLMALWPNLHPGNIIGLALVALVAADGCMRAYAASQRKAALAIALWALALVACSALNPTGVLPVWVGATEPFRWGAHEGIVEHVSLFEYWRMPGIGMLYPASLATLFVAVAALVYLSGRRPRASHAVLFLIFAYAGLRETRLAMFFVFISLVIAARHWPARINAKAVRAVSMAIVICAAVFFAARTTQAWRGAGGEPAYQNALPVKAAGLLMDGRVERPIFNTFNWGGYLAWRLYPSKVFITALLDDDEAYKRYRRIASGMGLGLLDSYGIRTVICDPVQVSDGRVSPLALALLKSGKWRLADMDELSAVFMRTDAAPDIASVDKQRLWLSLLKYAEGRAAGGDKAAWPEVSAIYFGLGRMDEAARALQRANQ